MPQSSQTSANSWFVSNSDTTSQTDWPHVRLQIKSVVSRSSSEVAQLSNLGLIQITCRVAARPFPTKPGVVQIGLKAEATVYEISADGARSLVPSEVNVSGGGSERTSSKLEWVGFYLNIPLDPAERDAEIRRFLVNFETSATDEHPQELVRFLQMNPQALVPMLSQYLVAVPCLQTLVFF